MQFVRVLLRGYTNALPGKHYIEAEGEMYVLVGNIAHECYVVLEQKRFNTQQYQLSMPPTAISNRSICPPFELDSLP